MKKNWKLIIWAKHQLLACLKRAMHTLLCPITQVRIMVVKIHFYNYVTRISYFAWKLDNIFGKKKKKIIFLKKMFGQKQLMSSAAHQFGRVEYCISNICYYFLQADVVEKSKQICIQNSTRPNGWATEDIRECIDFCEPKKRADIFLPSFK